MITKTPSSLIAFFLLFFWAEHKSLLSAVLFCDLSNRIFLVHKAIEPLHKSMGELSLNKIQLN